MKQIMLFFGLVLMFIPDARTQHDTTLSAGTNCPQGSWELVFAEEFTIDNLNTDRWLTWFPYTNDGSDQCAFCRTHAEGGQIYRTENAVVSNGSLKLIARYEPNTWFGIKRDYTSGMIHSRQSFGPGRYEIRCRVPEGMGFWPAIWAYGRTTTELDILEAGMQHTRRYHMSIHNRQVKKMLHHRSRVSHDLSADFHVYFMEWDTNFIRFGTDEQVLWSISRYLKKNGKNANECPVKPGEYRLETIFPPPGETVHLILNVAIGTEKTAFTRSPGSKTVLPAQMEIDWIRYYQRK
ncbi:MAG: glycoside hydrolase family 16 protein [Lentimicrobium sp.]|nr:glycoside hydrolase family 16 protein [Lentimicrobium sp.]